MPYRAVPSCRKARAVARRLARDTRGATAIEYGMILAVIVLVWFIGLSQMSGVTVGMWDNIAARVIKAR